MLCDENRKNTHRINHDRRLSEALELGIDLSRWKRSLHSLPLLPRPRLYLLDRPYPLLGFSSQLGLHPLSDDEKSNSVELLLAECLKKWESTRRGLEE